jgi:hypothetical protein
MKNVSKIRKMYLKTYIMYFFKIDDSIHLSVFLIHLSVFLIHFSVFLIYFSVFLINFSVFSIHLPVLLHLSVFLIHSSVFSIYLPVFLIHLFVFLIHYLCINQSHVACDARAWRKIGPWSPPKKLNT